MNAGINVAAIAATKKRGRPKTGNALSQAERDARYRAKRNFIKAARLLIATGLNPWEVLKQLT